MLYNNAVSYPASNAITILRKLNQSRSRLCTSFLPTRLKIKSCGKQDATMLWGPNCSSTTLFHIFTPDCALIQAQEYCSILLKPRNNVASTRTTLLHPVFKKLLQRHNFWPCSFPRGGPLL